MSEQINTLNVAMLGGTGVGKTSLLTAMYDRFDQNIGRANLQLTPDLESNAILGKQLGELKGMFNYFEPIGQGIQASTGERSFLFDIGKRGEAPSLRFHFIDYPGGYLETSPQTILQFIKNSAAILIAIDAPALMEQKGRWNETVNKPSQVHGLFKNAKLKELCEQSPRLFIFSPIKCEKYIQDAKLTKELLTRIKDSYKPLLDLFTSEAVKNNIAVVIAPVQTVGGIYFSRIVVNDGAPVFYFHKTNYNAEYSPHDSEQPLRYLLRFLLKLHYDSRRWQVFNFIRDWLNLDTHLREAVQIFAEGCNHNTADGFEVYSGNHLLTLK